jgi:hypothetical protein
MCPSRGVELDRDAAHPDGETDAAVPRHRETHLFCLAVDL